jgi:hypothetical protein
MLPDLARIVIALFPFLRTVQFHIPALFGAPADCKQKYPNNTSPSANDTGSSPLNFAESPPFYPSPYVLSPRLVGPSARMLMFDICGERTPSPLRFTPMRRWTRPFGIARLTQIWAITDLKQMDRRQRRLGSGLHASKGFRQPVNSPREGQPHHRHRVAE